MLVRRLAAALFSNVRRVIYTTHIQAEALCAKDV